MTKLKCSKYFLEHVFYNVHSESFPQPLTSTAAGLPPGTGGGTNYLRRFPSAQEKFSPSVTQRTGKLQIQPSPPSRLPQIKYFLYSWRVLVLEAKARSRRRCEGRTGPCGKMAEMGLWGERGEMWGENGAVRRERGVTRGEWGPEGRERKGSWEGGWRRWVCKERKSWGENGGMRENGAVRRDRNCEGKQGTWGENEGVRGKQGCKERWGSYEGRTGPWGENGELWREMALWGELWGKTMPWWFPVRDRGELWGEKEDCEGRERRDVG